MFASLLLELERLKVELQRREEDEEEEEEKENRQVGEQGKLTLVEELKEEIQQLQDRRNREGKHQEEEKQKRRVFAAVRREIERQEEEKGAGLQVSHTPTPADCQPIKTGKNKYGHYLSCLCRGVEGWPFSQNRMSASHHSGPTWPTRRRPQKLQEGRGRAVRWRWVLVPVVIPMWGPQ